MNLLFWGLTTGVIGKVLLAVGVLKAHSEIAHEHRIDKKVLRSFQLERTFTIIGLLLIVIGYAMEVYFYGFTTLLTCEGPECAALLNAALTE